MTATNRERWAIRVILCVPLLFILGQAFGGALFDNDWSFHHWAHYSFSFLALWFLIAGGVLYFFNSRSEQLAQHFGTASAAVLGLVAFFLLLLVLRFDSFLFAGGNLRVAQIAQAERVIFRWFEYGSILLVHLFDLFFDRFDLHYNTAGVLAWRLFSFGCVALTLTGAATLARLLAPGRRHRFYLLLILLFGPQALMLFGFIGVEPAVVTVSIWFVVLAMRWADRPTFGRLIALWGLVGLGVFMHYTLLYLFPGAVFVTLRGRRQCGTQAVLALAVSLVVWVLLIVVAYWWAGRNLEFKTFLLFLDGKPPLSNYGILSGKHLGDILQLLLLLFPQLILLIYLLIARREDFRTGSNLTLAALLSLSGMTVVFMLDPANGIVMDLPKLSAYLFPLALLLAVVLVRSANLRLTAIAAGLGIILLIGYLPSFIRISRADPYVTDYLEKNDVYYRSACLAFRDAYFYRKELRKADHWEWRLPTKSPAHLALETVKEYSRVGQNTEALRNAYTVVAAYPYWTDARSALSTIQMNLGNYARARPHIDTCLLLEPYGRQHHINRYRYYQGIGDLSQALRFIMRARYLFPEDATIKTDEMWLQFRLGNAPTADSLAVQLLATNPNLPIPNLLKGLLAEREQDTTGAITHFRKFILLDPESPDVPEVKRKLEALGAEVD